jgi:membrane associated rhomboid family serine protease
VVYLADSFIYKGTLSIQFGLRPASVFSGEVWRLFSNPLIHLDVAHLAMNSLSFLQAGRTLEPRFGALKFLFLVALFGCLSDSVLCIISFAMLRLPNYGTLYNNYSVGLGGALFALKVVECSIAQGTVSLHGIIDVPARLYPWLMLILMQALPNTSFVGHLSGLIAGYAYTFGFQSVFERLWPRRNRYEVGWQRREQRNGGYRWQGKGRRIG